jgi:DNA-binding response OmpR family regulator
MRIIIVEDEVRLAENMAAALREIPGFGVDCALDAGVLIRSRSLLGRSRSKVPRPLCSTR